MGETLPRASSQSAMTEPDEPDVELGWKAGPALGSKGTKLFVVIVVGVVVVKLLLFFGPGLAAFNEAV